VPAGSKSSGQKARNRRHGSESQESLKSDEIINNIDFTDGQA
jgi:hypothetical protein